jgi:hypothetical protein
MRESRSRISRGVEKRPPYRRSPDDAGLLPPALLSQPRVALSFRSDPHPSTGKRRGRPLSRGARQSTGSFLRAGTMTTASVSSARRRPRDRAPARWSFPQLLLQFPDWLRRPPPGNAQGPKPKGQQVAWARALDVACCECVVALLSLVVCKLAVCGCPIVFSCSRTLTRRRAGTLVVRPSMTISTDRNASFLR